MVVAHKVKAAAAGGNARGEDYRGHHKLWIHKAASGRCVARSRSCDAARRWKAGGTGKVRDCDEAVYEARDLCSNYSLLAYAISSKGSAMLKLTACAGDYVPAPALEQGETIELDEVEKGKERRKIEEPELLDQGSGRTPPPQRFRCFPDCLITTSLIIPM
jgi:hypothetical protein